MEENNQKNETKVITPRRYRRLINLMILKKNIITYFLIISILASSNILAKNEKNLKNADAVTFKKVEEEEPISEEEIDLITDSIYEETLIKNLKRINYEVPEESYNAFLTDKLLNTKLTVATETYLYSRMAKVVRENETLTKEQLYALLENMCSEEYFDGLYDNELDALRALFDNKTHTYEEKTLIIMAREDLTFEQLDAICAGMIAESGDNYDETYRTSSVLYNRAHSKRWIRSHGTSLYNQFVAPNQFEVYTTKSYKKYLGKRDMQGYHGALDMFYSREPSIPYLSFRAKNSNPSFEYKQFYSNGNKFGNPIKEKEKQESEYISTIEEELEESYTPDYSLYLKKN